jgi:hypothetical protein
MRAALEAALPPGNSEAVGAYLDKLWPPDAQERQALQSLAAGRIGETSGPLLESVISLEDAPGEAPSLSTPHAMSARERATPGAGVENAHGHSHITQRTPVPGDPEVSTAPGSHGGLRVTAQELAARERSQEVTRREGPTDVARRESPPHGAQEAWAALSAAAANARPSNPDYSAAVGAMNATVPHRPSRPDLIAAANAMLAAIGEPPPNLKAAPDMKATQRMEVIPKPRPSHPDQMHTVNAAPSPDLLRALQQEAAAKSELFVTVNRAPDENLLRAAAAAQARAAAESAPQTEPPPPAFVADDRFLDTPPEEEQPKTQVGTPVFPKSAPAPLPTQLADEDEPPPRRGVSAKVVLAVLAVLLLGAFFGVRAMSSRASTPAPAPAPAVTPPPAAAPHFLGKVEVELEEAVTVFNGDEELGASPGPFELEPGLHTLRVTSRSWGIDQELTVTVKQGESVKLTGPLKHGNLVVRATPWAMVKLDGRPLGQTPLKPRDVYEGTHVVELYNSELEVNKRMEVKVSAGETKTLNVRLNE